jgi:hypothetical protein
MNQRYKGALVVDIARLAGLNDDLTCDLWHPLNVAYRVPLSDAADEDMANAMADAIASAVAADHADDPAFDCDKAFEQALTDSRRMLVEPQYARLFGASAPQSLDEIVDRLTMKFVRDTDDHYVEPLWCSSRLFEVKDFGAHQTRDPGSGRRPGTDSATACAGCTATS